MKQKLLQTRELLAEPLAAHQNLRKNQHLLAEPANRRKIRPLVVRRVGQVSLQNRKRSLQLAAVLAEPVENDFSSLMNSGRWIFPLSVVQAKS